MRPDATLDEPVALDAYRSKRAAWRAGGGQGKPVTAFVLSGGASLAASQVGMLEALYEHGIAPDFVVGTSAGALNAAFISSRRQTLQTARELGRVWRSLGREDVFPVNLNALVGGVCGRRDHLVPDQALRRLVRRYLEFDDLEDAPIPVHVVAFDLMAGRELLLSSGPAVEAIAASAAIPGIFPPVMIGTHRLIDGGVVNNTPISCAAELGAERVYVLPCQYPCRPLVRTPKSALDAAIHGLGLLIASRLEADIATYSQQLELIVLPAPDGAGVQPTSFDHSAALIREARVLAQGALAHEGRGSHLRLA